MNYIILDMEWNQPLYSGMTVTEPVVLHAEVVQIGAVKLDKDFTPVDEFNVLIAPKYYKKMHKKVQSLTRITTAELQSGIPFPAALRDFLRWCGEDFVLLTWGPDDIPVLKDNLAVHSVDTDLLPQWYNLQVIFDAQITKEHRQFALGKALEILEETGGDAHNALNDAKNTALVCKHLDMVQGIENYDSLYAEFSVPCSDDSSYCGGDYSSKREVFKDDEVISFECPVCGAVAVCCDLVRQNAGKTLGIAKCEKGDELFVRFKLTKGSDERYRVKRAVYPINDEYKALYAEKKEIARAYNRSHRRKRSAAKKEA